MVSRIKIAIVAAGSAVEPCAGGAALPVRLMIPTPPKPKYPPGTRLRVTQYVRVGHRRWLTQVEGVVEAEGRRPVGGIEMGGKASYCQQPTLRLRRDDGEIIDVALDEDTKVEPIRRRSREHGRSGPASPGSDARRSSTRPMRG